MLDRADSTIGRTTQSQKQSGSIAYVCVVTLVAALGGLLFGYDTGVISGAIGFLSTRFELNADSTGWAASCALVGCIVGAGCAGALSDWMGRKRVLLLSAVLFAVSAIGSAVPRNLSQFAVARVLGGFGVGAASMMSPLYIAEIAPARIRGRLVSVNQFTIILGFLVVYLVNALVARRGESVGGEAWNIAYGWRWMFGSETLPAALFLALLFLVPESPRWLVKRGRNREAVGILTRVGGARQAQLQMAEIADAIAHEERSILQLIRPGMRIVMGIGVVLAVLQQVTGINAVLYYAPEIFKSAGLESLKAIDQTVIVGLVNLTFTLVAIWLVDKLGRKPLLLAASAGMGTSLFLLGGAFIRAQFEGPWVLLFTLTYVASFAVAMGPVVWVVLSEIFPTRLRGTAMSVATVCLWTANFFVTQFFPRMLEQLQGKSFFVYAVMCVVAFVFVAVFIPETKGKTLEEIEKKWLPRTP
jgi:SP family arabinose:H+ symporter-like MFS transporter